MLTQKLPKSNNPKNNPSTSLLDNIITVQGQSLTTKHPDQVTLTTKITSKKKDPSEANTSVNRRLEYILQVLKINGFDKNDIKYNIKLEDYVRVSPDLVSLQNGSIADRGQLTSSFSQGSRPQEYICTCNITAILRVTSSSSSKKPNRSPTLRSKNGQRHSISNTFQTSTDILNKAWETHNILLEKLANKNTENGSVVISKPVLTHSHYNIEKHLNDNGKLAIENAKKKAIDWCLELKAGLGSAVKILELENEVRDKGDNSSDEDPIEAFCRVEVTFSIVKE